MAAKNVSLNLMIFLDSPSCSVCSFAATAAGAAPVPAPGPDPARDPAAPGPHPALPACGLLQLRPALPLLHPGQLLSQPAAGREGGKGQRRCRESAQGRRWRQVRLVKAHRGHWAEGSGS